MASKYTIRSPGSAVTFLFLAVAACGDDDDDGAATADAGIDVPDARPAPAVPDARTPLPDGEPPPPPRDSPIAAENALLGSAGWIIGTRDPQLGAWAELASYAPGDTVWIHAAAQGGPTTASWELWRLGWYEGKGGRLVRSGGAVDIPRASATVLDSATGKVSTDWGRTFSVPLAADAPTGVYVVRVAGPAGATYALVVVREAAPAAPVLVVIPTNTYQAYNDWGGTSLYTNSRGDWSTRQAFAVSYDRPYQGGNGTGTFLSQDRPLIAWVEAAGYDVAYATDVDLDADPALSGGRPLVVIQGHSEYWTSGMRDNAEAAHAAGVNLAFLGANICFWKGRYEAAADGRPRRTYVSYKQFARQDPMWASEPAEVTTHWRDVPVNRPENGLLGVQFGDIVLQTHGPLVVADPGSWLWAGTGVAAGELVPGMYGYEVDRRYDNGAEPAGTTTVARGWVLAQPGSLTLAGAMATAESVIVPARDGHGEVFATGSIGWARALGMAGFVDPRIQTATANVFARLAGGGDEGAHVGCLGGCAPPAEYRPGVTVETVTTALVDPAAVAALGDGTAVVIDGNRLVRVDAAGHVTALAGATEPGFADGAGAAAAFAQPLGVAAAADGTIYVADTGNSAIRAVTAQGVVSTLAGGEIGCADATGAAARFANPTGVAVTPDGLVLVADMLNGRLRAVTPSGAVTTWASGFAAPAAVAVLADGSAAVADPYRYLLARVAGTADHAVTALAGEAWAQGWVDGPQASATFQGVTGLAPLADGSLVLLDTGAARVRLLAGGRVETLAGGASGRVVDGAGAAAGFALPRAAAAAPDGTILVVDGPNHALRRVRP